MKFLCQKFAHLFFLFVLNFFFFSTISLSAQVVEENELEEIVEINVNELKSNLLNAPVEFSSEAATQKTLINLPLPFGEQKTFSAQESPVIDKNLAVKYPEIKSYILFDTEGGTVSGRMSVTPKGVSYSIFTENGLAFLENFKDESANTAHKVYYGDLKGEDFGCSTVIEEKLIQPDIAQSRFSTVSTGATLRTYRIAIASSGEFTVGNGNSTASVNAVFNEKINQLNAIFERELTIRFVLAAGNDNLIFFDAATDGLDVNDRIGTAETVITANMASSDYDIGHVFYEIDLCSMRGDCMCNASCASTSGVATLGSVCQSYKARGWTGATSSASDDLFMGTFAHEIGHQFGAHHSYYGTEANCNQRSAGHGYEPGSGNSLMSYEGTCGSQNITPEVSTFYFHIHSIIQMLNHANGAGNCYAGTATGNTPPVASAPADVTIPHGTPFTITGSGTDGDGDNLTYIWEQYDTDNSAGGSPISAATSTTAPLFRSFDPSSSGNVRTFPQISDIITNMPTLGEILPQVARTMHFRLTARDNNANGGGVHCDEVAITVDDSGVPFAVTLPTSANSYTANGSNSITVNWNVGATANAPISCSTVDIQLSTDGGNSFPITLATGVTNDGTETIVLPSGLPNTSSARIKVSCTNGGVQFFDISDGDFVISSTCIAETSFQCPTVTVTAAEGNAATNLSINELSGASITSKTFNVLTSGDKMDVITEDPSGNCLNHTFQRHYGVLEFTVDQSGSYTFIESISGFMILNLFQNSFDANNPCPTWLASTAIDDDGNPSGGISGSNSFSFGLTACTTYYLTISQYGSNSNFSGDVSISGLGNVTELETLPPSTSYTFIAINQSTNIVSAQSATSDFTSLPGNGGTTYDVYGVSYDNAETPSSWVGLTQSALLDGSRCLLLSNNKSTLTVTGGTSCPTTSVMSGTETICKDETTNLSVAITDGASPYTVVYSDGSSNTTINGYTSGSNIPVSPMSTTTYTLVSVTDDNGCLGTGNSGSAIVTVHDGSTSATMSGTATITSGNSTPISVAISGGSSPYTLVYNDGSSDISLPGYTSGTAISVSPTSNTTYTIVSVTDNNDCEGTGNTGSAIITVNTPPSCPNTLNVTAVAHNQTYEAANTLTSSIVIPPTNTVTFHAGQSITLGVGFHAAPTSTHVFHAAISSCTPFQAPAVARNNSSNPDEQTNLSLAPNPAVDFLTVDYQLGEVSTASIGLYDMTGKRLMDIVPVQAQAKGKYQQQFSLGNLQAGMYFVLLQTETEQISKKLILVR